MTSINSKSGCPGKNIESLRCSLITILLKCDGSLMKTTCTWRKVISPRLDLICVVLRSHLVRVNSFIECREPSAPLMTKPLGILAPSHDRSKHYFPGILEYACAEFVFNCVFIFLKNYSRKFLPPKKESQNVNL